MEHLIYASIIILGLALFLYLWNNEHRTVREVIREKEEIEIEEHRMFDFLHGLGEGLIEDSSPSSMHRYITEGITEVVDGDAGVLYLVDHVKDRIVPVAQTKTVAPVLPFPPNLTGTEKKVAQQYRSMVRLAPLDLGEGVIGKTLSRRAALMMDDLAEFFDEDEYSETFHKGTALLSSPLIYANKKIGVIAVTRSNNRPFNKNDRDVFASVAEQCAYALGSFIIHAEASEKRRLEQELAQASEIQRILLPKKRPELSDFSLAATYRPARHVSGDYYDYVKLDRDHYGVAIADVCGKGIAASLIMAMCRSSLRSAASENLSPSSVLHQVNASLFPDIREDMFVSFLYLILERDSDIMTVSNAGHEPPLLRKKKTGKIEEDDVATGIAVGVDKGSVFSRVVKDHQIRLEKGDVLLLYTDGLIEAANRDGEEFGIERFRLSFEKAEGETAQEVLDAIMNDIEDFTKGTQATDDITLIAVEKR